MEATSDMGRKTGIDCIHCAAKITEYYHDGYRGARGRCSRCGVDFPLE